MWHEPQLFSLREEQDPPPLSLVVLVVAVVALVIGMIVRPTAAPIESDEAQASPPAYRLPQMTSPDESL